jgi:hypothetical protein
LEATDLPRQLVELQDRDEGRDVMPTSTASAHTTARVPLRIRLRTSPSADRVDGAWWPQSRNLQDEAADLIDHLPVTTGYVNRLLFSRPDWDDGIVAGSGARRIQAKRGPVKVGSFPSDDTRMMILTMAGGQRLRLRVIPSDADPEEADRLLRGIADASGPGDAGDAVSDARWDGEHPIA